jgi:uncharacterized protein YciI
MPEFIYVVRPVRPAMLTEGLTEAEEHIVAQHFEYLRTLVQEGRVLIVGRTLIENDRTFGLAVFRADDLATATLLAEADPAVLHGVMRVEVYPFRVVLMSSTWSTA